MNKNILQRSGGIRNSLSLDPSDDPNDLSAVTSRLFKILNNKLPADGFDLMKDLIGETLEIILAPNESKTFSHGLRRIPTTRIIVKQSGNGILSDEVGWTDNKVVFKNFGSGQITVTVRLM